MPAHNAVNLRELVRDPKRILSSALIGQLCEPKFVEILCMSGKFDVVWFDQEHVGLTMPQIEHAARAARSLGIPSFVRLYAQNYADVMRPLEAGSDGIMVDEDPRVLMGDDFVQRGSRGFRDMHEGEHRGTGSRGDFGW